MSLILFLGSLEIGLRIVDRRILVQDAIGNEIHPQDAHAIRIVTIGESMTADRPDVTVWARRLEQKLKQNGIDARVYNIARPATTSSLLMADLQEQLEHYRPQIVISMMGLADVNAKFLPAHPGWLGNLAIARTYRWYRLLRARRKTERQAGWLDPKDWGTSGATQEIVARLKSGKPGSADPLIAEQIRTLNDAQRAQYYIYLGRSLERITSFHFPETPQLELGVGLARRSLAARFQVWVAAGLAFMFADRSREDDCLDLARQIVGHGWVGDDEALSAFSRCAAFSWQSNSVKKNRWPGMIRNLSGDRVKLEFMDRSRVLVDEYRDLHHLLASLHCVHIAMQYPTRNVEALKDYFKSPSGEIDPEFRDILYVSNQENFAAELAKRPYDEVFQDRFGDSFGHSTDIGHILTVDALYPVVQQAIARLHPPQLPHMENKQ